MNVKSHTFNRKWKQEHNLLTVTLLEVILRTLLVILTLLPSACNFPIRELPYNTPN